MSRLRLGLPQSSAGLAACLAALVLLGSACSRPETPIVVVYATQDQTYAEPILNEFTRQTGVKTKTVYDSEAVKTVGLANRLLAEKAHPQCDVFWSNEEFRTRLLAAQGVFRETNGWFGFGYRSRRLVINTNHVNISAAPRDWKDLTNSHWHGKLALAYPLFGTTASHFLAWKSAWPAGTWENWCRALKANTPWLVDGNSVVVQLVGRGEAWIGMTDSDDIVAGQKSGLPIQSLPLLPDTLLIPNTVGMVRGAPHPEAAQKLADYLRGPTALNQLVAAGALEGAAHDNHSLGLAADWNRMLAELESSTAFLKSTFLR